MRLIKDKQKAIKEVSKYGLNLEYVSDELKDDEEVVRKALHSRVSAIQYASDRFRLNKDFILEYINTNAYMLNFIDPIFLKDKEIVTSAVGKHGHLLKYVDESFKYDIRFVRNLLIECGLAINDVFYLYKDNKEMAMIAVKENPFAFDYISPRLRHDKDILKIFTESLKDENLLKNVKDKFLKYFEGGALCEYDDYDVILYLIEKEKLGIGLCSADDDIKDDEYIVLKAIEENPLVLSFASDRLKNDLYTVATAVKRNGFALLFASEEMKKNKTIIKYALEENKEVEKFLN